MIGYPKKNTKKKKKNEFNSNLEWKNYKVKYENEKNEIQLQNTEYNKNEKFIKRIILKLIIDKYVNLELFKRGNGINRIWNEEFKLYEKSKKILNNEKKIYI